MPSMASSLISSSFLDGGGRGLIADGSQKLSELSWQLLGILAISVVRPAL